MECISRPDFFDDESSKYWIEFHDWVAECDMPIYINSAFSQLHKLLKIGKHYMGQGMYCFGFDTEEDKEVFRKKLGL